MSSPQKKVSLKDVAQYVGVSAALVSYVLNGQAVEKQVNKDTAERILLAAKLLNYQPDQIAKSLKMQKTFTLGLVVADINYRFSTGITKAIEEEAKKSGYTVIFGSSNEKADKFSELINVFTNKRVDGLILVPVENSEKDIIQLQKLRIPFVLVDRNFPAIQTNYIALDNYKAAYAATEYLIGAGHKRIAMVNYKTTLFHLLERNRGYKEALQNNGISYKKELAVEIKRDDTTKQPLDKVLGLENRIDALFFATDTLTINGLKHLYSRNLKVPDDVSVMSFDESDAFELFYLPVTHSKQPLQEMGKLAVSTLIKLIDHGNTNMQINLKAEIVKGKSCRE